MQIVALFGYPYVFSKPRLLLHTLENKHLQSLVSMLRGQVSVGETLLKYILPNEIMVILKTQLDLSI